MSLDHKAWNDIMWHFIVLCDNRAAQHRIVYIHIYIISQPNTGYVCGKFVLHIWTIYVSHQHDDFDCGKNQRAIRRSKVAHSKWYAIGWCSIIRQSCGTLQCKLVVFLRILYDFLNDCVITKYTIKEGAVPIVTNACWKCDLEEKAVS